MSVSKNKDFWVYILTLYRGISNSLRYLLEYRLVLPIKRELLPEKKNNNILVLV